MLRLNVPLSLFSVDCQSVNEELANRVWKLRDILIQFELDENRDVNRRWDISLFVRLFVVWTPCDYFQKGTYANLKRAVGFLTPYFISGNNKKSFMVKKATRPAVIMQLNLPSRMLKVCIQGKSVTVVVCHHPARYYAWDMETCCDSKPLIVTGSWLQVLASVWCSLKPVERTLCKHQCIK